MEIIVKKGSQEFTDAKSQFLALFQTDQPGAVMGVAYMQPNPSLRDLWLSLPKPFSCQNLELYIWPPKEGKGAPVAFFCNRIGCLCTPCREDLEGEYPTYCPSEYIQDDEGFWEGDDDFWDDEEEEF